MKKRLLCQKLADEADTIRIDAHLGKSSKKMENQDLRFRYVCSSKPAKLYVRVHDHKLNSTHGGLQI